MVLSTSPFDSVVMFPSGCFYPPQVQSQKWENDDPGTRPHNGLEAKYDPSGRFPQADPSKYSLDNGSRYPLEFKYPQDMRYQLAFHPSTVAHADFPCQLSFHSSAVSESYPTDPFPSTSVALPNGFKMDNGYPYYPNAAMVPQAYAPPAADCFAASQQFSQFKMPSVGAMNGVKMGSAQGSSQPPYRTGPGTNNVRVRTTEKYRMVYTDHQRLELEKEFLMAQFINAERKAQLSSNLQLTERQIKIWFQNRSDFRRAKDRRDGKRQKRVAV